MRIIPIMRKKEPTYQVVLDALALSPLYPAFLITAEVPEIYMQQIYVEVFRDILQIYPRHPNQEFVKPPSLDEEIVSFIKELCYKGDIESIIEVYTDHMHQPWRTFTAIINRFLSGKMTCLDKIHLSREQILWGINTSVAQKENMPYPRFTKAIIHHFISKEMTNLKMQNSPSYKTYLAFTIGASTPKKARKFKKPASPSKKKTLVAVEEPAKKLAKKPTARRLLKEAKRISSANTVKFGNDQIAKIMGYGDYQIRNVTIYRVYYVEGLGHNLFSVGQFCYLDLEVAFCKHTCFVRNLEGVDLLSGSQGTNFYYEDVSICHETFVARTSQQNGVVERRNRTLVETVRTMLIYAKAPLFLWAEVVATTFYTKNRSLIRLHHGKTPYELLHDRKPNLSYLHVFGALCYLTKDSENLGKLKAKADVGIFIGYAPAKKAYRIYKRRTKRMMEIIHVDFNELTGMAFEQSTLGPTLHEMTPVTLSSGLVPQLPEVAAPVSNVSTCSPSSTLVDQDAPSPSTSQTLQVSLFHVIALDDEEVDHDIEVAHMDNNPQFGIPIPEPSSEESSSHVVIPNNSYKEALTQSFWIEAMQEELNEFERLVVWELVPRLDRVMIITLKWIYKIKLHELGVARLEAIRNFLAFTAHMKIVVYQMDVKTGLKQAPRAWYDLLLSFILFQKFSKGTVDPTLFIRRESKDILLISQSPSGIFLNQSKYALEIINKYGMETSDPMDTLMVDKSKLDADPKGKAVDPTRYRGMIGSPMYLTTRTINMGLWYSKDSCIALTAFADADHVGCQDTRRSTSGSMQLLGDRLVSWSSKKLKSIDISNTEAEYIAFSGCCAQILWMRSQLTDYGLGFNKIPLYHFIKEQVENGVVELYLVKTKYQLTYIFTKALGRERLDFLINKLGMRSMSPEALKSLADEEDE
ncbi:retrovirus-related pol polyprotein from transposon TNT 1-94 [Tanacetum coccineum]